MANSPKTKPGNASSTSPVDGTSLSRSTPGTSSRADSSQSEIAGMDNQQMLLRNMKVEGIPINQENIYKRLFGDGPVDADVEQDYIPERYRKPRKPFPKY
jgi:hypothetical protein